jgi:hypothetical protein
MKKPIYISQTKLKFNDEHVGGEYITIDHERYYKISNYNLMAPFFMSIVSDSNHWMFISSNGPLTCGRKNPDQAIFPYYTDDKIHDSAGLTGSKTMMFLEKKDRMLFWEPFSSLSTGFYAIERKIYKSVLGDKIIFEEINDDLKLTFRYGWFHGEKYGFIKQSKIINNNNDFSKIIVLDGIQNILPPGVEGGMQNNFSTLVDAYKKGELAADRVGLYTLNSIPVDKAEPSEALLATIVWSEGIKKGNILLSSQQLEKFKRGEKLEQENETRAQKGAYFINTTLELCPTSGHQWNIVIDTNQDSSSVVDLIKMLNNEKELNAKLKNDVKQSSENLINIVANADGLQMSNDEAVSSRHISNVLFNSMRGGTFIHNYLVEKDDFIDFCSNRNKGFIQKRISELLSLPASLTYQELLKKANLSGDADFMRICYEYLPLYFGRRHGDPSRPWNAFSIDTINSDNSKKLSYQGNWRDIFQNWEALGYSFPGYIESMIAKFVNAVTIDGYNPYRIMRDGIEWEVLDKSDPWSNIGYWGDHQVIYLLKLMELSVRFHPELIETLLAADIYTYANLPYRQKSFDHLIKNPHNTIDFESELDQQIKEKVDEIGTDAKLIWAKGSVYHVNLAEKLLVILAAKMSNFIPGAGIWMNTQRPEWNDANNALVGFGVSMVTLYYLRRYTEFLLKIFPKVKLDHIGLSREVADYIDDIYSILTITQDKITGSISAPERLDMLEKLGRAGGDYRSKVYQTGFSEHRNSRSIKYVSDFFKLVIVHLDASIKSNVRKDNLYHSYNLISVNGDNGLSIRYLHEMLEGQVAVLSSGFLDAEKSLQVLNALQSSALYRHDQMSYMLYPDKDLSPFIKKNNIPNQLVLKSKLLQNLVTDGNKDIIIKDINGDYHFNSEFRNADYLNLALKQLLKTKYKKLVKEELELILNLYEEVFDHHSFTGRSGTFFKYEGLGSIYWHMVSKLLLAVQEVVIKATKEGASDSIIFQLKQHYAKIKIGIGIHKPPEKYGGFPTDPYSHTPANFGAQQPGLTGQVKEDIIVRFSELGINIDNGQIMFSPQLLNKNEFCQICKNWEYVDIANANRSLELEPMSLGYTFCQVPIIYHISDDKLIRLTFADQSIEEQKDLFLNYRYSSKIFERTGDIIRIDVYMDTPTA